MSKISILRNAALGVDDGNRADLPHVLLVVDQFPRTLGGGERIVLRLAGLLPKYGYRASILTFAAHPASDGLKSPPCNIYLLPLPRTYDLEAIRAAFQLRTFLEQQNVRLVQTFFESSDLWAGAVTKLLSDATLIWSRRDMGILRARKHRMAYRLLAGMPDRVFAVSEEVRRYCIDVDHIDPGRTETIYNGLDLNDWSGRSVQAKKGNELVVTTVGNIRRVKGHDLLVRVAARIVPHFPQVTFTVGGEILESDYFAELEALVLKLGLSGRFQFLGGVTDLRSHLAAADVFVLPSRSEGFSNAIIEAMAASLPVVATDVGGNAEAIKNGVSGYIVPPEDPTALAAGIMQLLRDPSQARRMGAAGRHLAAEHFTTEAMMRRTTEAYDSLLGRTALAQFADGRRDSSPS